MKNKVFENSCRPEEKKGKELKRIYTPELPKVETEELVIINPMDSKEEIT